jgi:hypothetical protein
VARFLRRVKTNKSGERPNLVVVKVSTGESRDIRRVRMFAFARCDVAAGSVLTVADTLGSIVGV